MKTETDRMMFLTVVIWTACFGALAQGDFRYDFETPPPSSLSTGVIGPTSSTYGTSFDGGMFRLADSRTPAEGGAGAAVGLGAFGLEQSEMFGDVRISAILNPAGDSDDLLNLTRGHGGVGVYAAGLEFSSGRLTIAKLLPGGQNPVIITGSDQSAQGSQPLLADLKRSYYLEFDVIGAELDARLYDHANGNELLHVHLTDENLGPPLLPSIAGVSVIWLGDNSTNLDGTFDDFSAVAIPATPLRAGDADQDLDFDQLDLVQVQTAAKYLTGLPATWGEGDWNGAPGGRKLKPPAGDGQFNQFDIIAAQQAGIYLAGPYAAIRRHGRAGDAQVSLIYSAATGELAVDALDTTRLTSINFDSAAGVFTGNAAQNLGGSFDNDTDHHIFKATFGSSFGSLRFGNVVQAGLAEDLMLDDLTVVGSLAGGGPLENVDLVYVPVPEPTTAALFVLGVVAVTIARRRTRNERT